MADIFGFPQPPKSQLRIRRCLTKDCRSIDDTSTPVRRLQAIVAGPPSSYDEREDNNDARDSNNGDMHQHPLAGVGDGASFYRVICSLSCLIQMPFLERHIRAGRLHALSSFECSTDEGTVL